MASVIIEQTGDGKQISHTNVCCPYYKQTLQPGERCETCAALDRFFRRNFGERAVLIVKYKEKK